jgi:gamma-glutamyltranspeptidase
VARAAALGVVYPHMTGLGGDGFWLVAEPGKEPVGIRACGPAASAATPEFYRAQGLDAVPTRGPGAALTVAGAVGGWAQALELSRTWGGKTPLARLLSEARRLALQGTAVTKSQAVLTREKFSQLVPLAGFADAWAPHGPPAEGTLVVQSRQAAVLADLAAHGLDSFYRGAVAQALAADLADVGSPLIAADLAAYHAVPVVPLSVNLSVGTVYNLPPPTQGVSSLAILALFDRLGVKTPEGFDHIHGLVEATKKAFAWRNAHVGDPATMDARAEDFLASSHLDSLVWTIDRQRAAPWPEPAAPGDTVWFGAIDAQGRAVSCIQSLYWEFGSGLVLPRTGLFWQNRGSSFTLGAGPNQLAPGRLPFHTLNPALARIKTAKDGEVKTVVYGTMGGEGQPQTQAAFLTRYAWFGQGLRGALDGPRWLLGRTWGEDTFSLRLESRFAPATVRALEKAGHAVEVLGPWDDRMGHAGAVVRHPDGRTEAAHDPRADGSGLTLDADPAPWHLNRFLTSLAQYGAETDGGVTRLLYDGAWQAARKWLSAEFGALGFTVRDDRVGNLYGRLDGTQPDKVILTGSHFDTVRHGGWYDGAYGVAASAVALADLKRRFGPPLRTVEVVAFAEEEGSRFPLAYWGSGNLTGRWPLDWGDDQKDPDGVSLTQAMSDAGWGRYNQPDPRRTDLGAFVEVHIEQGIVLERSREQIGVVEAIVGQRRWLVKLTGEANHAGTTPMALRRDALAGAVEMMALVEAEARRRGSPLVATVGFVDVAPNTPNVVPGTVSFSVDARHTKAADLEHFCAFLQASFQNISRRRNLGFALEPRLSVEPQPMDPVLQGLIIKSCRARNLTYRALPSGAGHDSQVVAGLCPTAMVFVPSRAGVSHSPLEFSTHHALADGLAVLSDVLYELAWKGASV